VVDFDSGLNRAINRLREALGDDAENPRFIETLPQRGYRFLAEVESSPAEPQAPTTEPAPMATSAPRSSRRWWIAIAAVLIAAPLLTIGYRRIFSQPPRIESIAVLPLENLSGSNDQEYFSDGMTDQLIGEIARIGSLRVISRTSIMQYKGAARKSLPAIARELNVDSILEGTVVHSGSKVRITAQLIRAWDDRHLWSEEYERNLTDVLALQGEVARAIASQIQINLTPQEQKRLTRTRSVQPEAYNLFLQGNFFVQQGIKSTAKSIELFRRAIELDPSQAEFHAGLAEALCYAAIHGLRPSGEAYPAARASALKALELDESNASAHDALGDVIQGYDRDVAGAQVEFKRALELNPGEILVRVRYAENLTRMGKFDQAVQITEKTVALDPVSPISYSSRAMIFFRARRYDESIHASQQALEFDPSSVQALWWQGVSYAGKRDFPKSLASLTKALSIADEPLLRGYLGLVYGQAGENDKAFGILKELATLSRTRWVSPIDYALVYAGLGDADSTFAWLEKGYQAHEMRFELASFYYDSFRSDPRYADLARRLGFPLQALARH
jgi:TolB-like protein/Tfp pilus assembly protein PilF